MQSVRLSAPSLGAFKRIDLAVESSTVLNIVDTAVTVAGTDSQAGLLRELAVLLLCPPSPFVNSLAQPVAFTNKLLADTSESQASTVLHQRQILVSVLAASISEIATAILDRAILMKELT